MHRTQTQNRWWTHSLTVCFFLLSVVPSTVFAAVSIIATNNCHVLTGPRGVPGFSPDDSVKKYGVTRDVYSYYARFKDSATAAFKADVEAYYKAGLGQCYVGVATPIEAPYINGGPVYDLFSDNTRVLASLVSNPQWIAEYIPNDPDCYLFKTSSAIITVWSIYAPLQKINQQFHGFSDESVDLINATCLGQQQYIIKLSNDANPPASGDLAEVEPGKVTTTLRARVYDNNNQPVPNVNVKLEVTVEANSGGHQHNVDRPKGAVSPAEGNTGTAGSGHAFTFTAPTPAGDHKIKATCTGGQACTQEGPDKVWVGVKDLVSLYDTHLYKLTGSDTNHPGNHYLTYPATGNIVWLAQLYREALPVNPVLHLNDASLVWGGLFDIATPWQEPHPTHRRGTEIDIRANPLVHPDTAIPETSFADFERLVLRRIRGTFCGAPGYNIAYPGQTKQHYHVCLMGGHCCSGGN